MFIFVVQKQAVEKSFPPKAETNPTMASQICLQDGVETRGKRGKRFRNPLRAATAAALEQ